MSRNLDPTTVTIIALERGDVIRLTVGGGGGFGDPSLRSRESIERVIGDQRITLVHAIEAYGYNPDDGRRAAITAEAAIVAEAD